MVRRRRPGEADEHQVQAAFFDLVALHASRSPLLGLIHAIPNGGARHRRTAGRLKAEGVRAGVPDVHWPVASGPYIGLWIEFKRPWNDLSDRQRVWVSALRRAGHRVAVCHEAEEAWGVVLEYLRGLRPVTVAYEVIHGETTEDAAA